MTTPTPALKKKIEDSIKQSVHIKDQYPDEEILLYLHRHWIIFAGHLVVLGVLILIPIVIFVIGPSLLPIAFEPPWSGLILLVALLYIMFVWLYFFVAWVDYYLDSWIVTNRRVLNIEQIGLFRRVISVQSLGNVQDVTSEKIGALRTFLDFGNVEVQTAGEAPRFLFEDVKDPDRVRNIILKASQDYKKRHYVETNIESNVT